MGVATLTQAAQQVIDAALAEDVGRGDLTTTRLFEPGTACTAELLLKEPGTIAGLGVATAVFTTLDPSVEIDLAAADGREIDEPRGRRTARRCGTGIADW